MHLFETQQISSVKTQL